MYFSVFGASYKIVSITPKRSLETQVFEKKAKIHLKKRIGQIFLILSSMAKLRKQIIWIYSVR